MTQGTSTFPLAASRLIFSAIESGETHESAYFGAHGESAHLIQGPFTEEDARQYRVPFQHWDAEDWQALAAPWHIIEITDDGTVYWTWHDSQDAAQNAWARFRTLEQEYLIEEAAQAD